MKKILLALISCACIGAYAEKVVVLNEDFSWLSYGSEKGWVTTGETRIDNWTAAEKAKGWTSKASWCYARIGFVKLGKTNYGGDVCSPKLAKIGSKPTKATLTFQAVNYSSSTGVLDPGKLYVGIVGGGKIVSVSGGAGNDAVNASFSNAVYGIKGAADITLAGDNHFDPSETTGSEVWKQANSHYTVEIADATENTQIVFIGGNYNTTPTNRVFLDNIKVEAEIEIDTTEMSMVVRKKNGSLMAIRNVEVDSISFEYSSQLSDDSYVPDTVYTLGREFPEGTEAYGYVGKRVDLENDLKYTFVCTANNGVAHQSSAAYGDYLFMVKDKLASIHMYNLKRKSMVCSCTLTAHAETTSASSSTVLYHCNQSTFGTIKYDESDPFPLLYVSQRAPSSTQRCFINVLRIIPVKNVAGTEYASFTVEEVQTIQLPAATDANALGNANFTIDPQTGEFYSYSRNNNSGASNYYNCRITKYSQVDLSKKEVLLEDSDIKESYEIFYPHNNQNISALNMQGAFIWNKKLYISQGYPSCNFINLHVVDLEAKKSITYINLLNDGFPVEPEGCFLYNGQLMLSCNGTPIYTLYFK